MVDTVIKVKAAHTIIAHVKAAFAMSEKTRLEHFGIDGIDLMLDSLTDIVQELGNELVEYLP